MPLDAQSPVIPNNAFQTGEKISDDAFNNLIIGTQFVEREIPVNNF